MMKRSTARYIDNILQMHVCDFRVWFLLETLLTLSLLGHETMCTLSSWNSCNTKGQIICDPVWNAGFLFWIRRIFGLASHGWIWQIVLGSGNFWTEWIKNHYFYRKPLRDRFEKGKKENIYKWIVGIIGTQVVHQWCNQSGVAGSDSVVKKWQLSSMIRWFQAYQNQDTFKALCANWSKVVPNI